jgi:hypothetical protein
MTSSTLQNKTLRDVENAIEASFDSENARKNYMKVLLIGMNMGLKGDSNSILSRLKNNRADPISDCALVPVNLIQIMLVQSRGTLPPQAAIPAAMTMMLHALDFAEKAKIIKLTMSDIIRATHIYTNQVFKIFNIKPQQFMEMSRQVQVMTEDPAMMEQIKRHAGVVKHPGASEDLVFPTPAAPPPVAVPRNRAERRAGGRR